MRFNREPFSSFNVRINIPRVNTFLRKADQNLMKKVTSTDNLMYNTVYGGIMDARTGKYYTGKFVIPADKFERIVKVINGQEVSSLVRSKNGKNFYAEIFGHEPRRFRSLLSPEQINIEIEKMLSADQAVYDKMMDRFEKSGIVSAE